VLDLSSSLLADTSSLIVLSGLIFAVFLVLALVVVIVVCFRRNVRRRRKYRAVGRDPPPTDGLQLKAFPPDGGTYHAGCDLGLSASGSVCLCRDLSGAPLGDSASLSSAQRTSCRAAGCDVTMTSHHKMAESECHRRCSTEVGSMISCICSTHEAHTPQIKSAVFSLVLRLSTRHCPHLLLNAVLRRRCCWAPAPAAVDRYANDAKYIYFICLQQLEHAFSVLTLLVGRQEEHPACKKTEWWGAGVVICLERARCRLAYGPADATATHCLLFQ